MQLTWLIGAPSRPVSVHQRARGRVGLGSPATQLMRAVSPLFGVKGTRGKRIRHLLAVSYPWRISKLTRNPRNCPKMSCQRMIRE